MSLGEAQVRTAAQRESLRLLVRNHSESSANPNDLAGYRRWIARWGPWVARAGVVACLAVGVLGLSVAIVGLWDGHVVSFQRYKRIQVSRSDSPVLFWFSICFHVAAAACYLWLARQLQLAHRSK